MSENSNFKVIDDGIRLEFIGSKPTNVTEALNLSIEKWKILRDDPEIIFDGSASTCGLCMLYFWDADCDGCPIYELDRHHLTCRGTPYEDHYRSQGNAERYESARKEVKFLKKVKRDWELLCST